MSDSHIRYVITGHSRGAAVGNLVEADIIKNYRAASRVFGYNYACPNTATHGTYDDIYCPTVFNFWNVNDIVPYVPRSDTPIRTLDVRTSIEYMIKATLTDDDEWGKYGKNLFFTRGVDVVDWLLDSGQWNLNIEDFFTGQWTSRIKDYFDELVGNIRDNHMRCYHQYATDVYYNGAVYRNQP